MKESDEASIGINVEGGGLGVISSMALANLSSQWHQPSACQLKTKGWTTWQRAAKNAKWRTKAWRGRRTCSVGESVGGRQLAIRRKHVSGTTRAPLVSASAITCMPSNNGR